MASHSGPWTVLFALVRQIDGMLLPLYAIGARRIAEQYHALDSEPVHDTWIDDGAEESNGVAPSKPDHVNTPEPAAPVVTSDR